MVKFELSKGIINNCLAVYFLDNLTKMWQATFCSIDAWHSVTKSMSFKQVFKTLLNFISNEKIWGNYQKMNYNHEKNRGNSQGLGGIPLLVKRYKPGNTDETQSTEHPHHNLKNRWAYNSSTGYHFTKSSWQQRKNLGYIWINKQLSILFEFI